jgi:hypothetical protein
MDGGGEGRRFDKDLRIVNTVESTGIAALSAA